MTLHIQKFIDRINGLESRGAKDFVMPLSEAKDLHTDITRLLLEFHDLREKVANTRQEEVITVKMHGGSF